MRLIYGFGTFRAKTISYQDISSGTTHPIFFVRVIYHFSGHLVPSFINGFNSLVLVLYVQNLLFSIFYQLNFKRLFDYAELKRYDDLAKQT